MFKQSNMQFQDPFSSSPTLQGFFRTKIFRCSLFFVFFVANEFDLHKPSDFFRPFFRFIFAFFSFVFFNFFHLFPFVNVLLVIEMQNCLVLHIKSDKNVKMVNNIFFRSCCVLFSFHSEFSKDSFSFHNILFPSFLFFFVLFCSIPNPHDE